MVERNGLETFFAKKLLEWARRDGSAHAHVARLGEEGLEAEFRSDPEFSTVARYFREVAQGPYVQDASLGELRVTVREILRGSPGGNEGGALRRDANRVVRAAARASGFRGVEQRLVRVVGALPKG